MIRSSTPYRLVPARPAPVVVPQLDDDQRRVVAHRSGPLLVLAGPGTGKTTTLVEAVAARVALGTPLDRVLVLTFSRKAAAELRRRITARVGATVAAPAAWTFHAFCYALVRAWSDTDSCGSPPRLLSGPEQDVAIRELLRARRRPLRLARQSRPGDRHPRLRRGAGGAARPGAGAGSGAGRPGPAG